MKTSGLNREKVLLIITLTVLGLLVLDRLLLSPFITSYEAKASQIDQLKEALEKGELVLSREKVILEHWNNLLIGSLSPEKRENYLLSRVESWNQKSGLEIQSVKPEHILSKREGPERMACRIFAKGEYREICQFLLSMRVDNLNIHVERCDIISKSATGNNLNLVLHFSCLILDKGEKPS